MTHALLLTLLAFAPQQELDAPEVQARVSGTYLAVSLRMAGYADHQEAWESARRELGAKAVLFGHLGEGTATVSIVAERVGAADRRRTSAEWRERFTGGEGEAFAVGEIACREATLDVAGLRKVDFNAFPLAAGYCFDVHVSTLVEGDDAPFDRADFQRLIASFRVAFLRRGWREDYPDAALDAMHAMATRGAEWKAWFAAEVERRPDDPALPFARAEYLKVLGAPNEEQAAAYRAALPLFEALERPTKPDLFAWAVCEDGLGLALANSGELEQAVSHYRAGFAVAERAGHRVRGPLAYNLACALALGGEADEALQFLARAIEVDPRYHEMGREDADFRSLRDRADFRELVGIED